MFPIVRCLFLCAVIVPVAAVAEGVADTPFVQEYHARYLVGENETANDVRAIAVDQEGNVWSATRAGVYVLRKGEERWAAMTPESAVGPAFDVTVDRNGVVWVGAWDGLFRCSAGGLEQVGGVAGSIAALGIAKEGIVVAGCDGIWRVGDDGVKQSPVPCSKSIRRILVDGDGSLWIATGEGLYHDAPGGGTLYQTVEEILAANVSDVARNPDGQLWAAGLAGVTLYENGKRVGQFTTANGLPSVYVHCVACAPDGTMWVGTDMGVSRYDGATWSLRHSQRWLVSDDVRDVAFDADGTAWVATGGGVSAIRRREMTLADKADLFEEVCMARHVRAPWLVEKCRLPVPGDTSKWEPVDDDNDGQYTAMHLVMESFRYAATHDPEAQANAKKAFDALQYLQTVTETPGFVARTVIPSDWRRMNDPGDRFTDAEWAERRVEDPRNKKVEKRWHLSSDGNWLWKSDTSSDEITGHFYGYLYYYDLAADETERERVAAHVRRVMDYIIDGGYVLKDLDGTHTRWGVWAPERLNGDPDWAAERGINSVEILSFLKTTHHMTGDEKYQREYLRLLTEHDYAANVRRAKTYGPAWRTHIDDELLALAYPALLLYEEEPALRQLYRESLDYWYKGLAADKSPFFNYVYASLAGKDPNPEDSIAFLRDVPLDLVNWRIDNSRREDLTLVRAPEIEPLQTSRLVPPSERGVIRWDKNPWEAVQGDAGHTEWSPTYWLLPYWMGRYYGFIQPLS